MKKIFGHYGLTVVSIVVALVLSTIFFELSFDNQHNFQTYLGTSIKDELEMRTGKSRTGRAFDITKGRALPVIFLYKADALSIRKPIAVGDIIKAYDAYSNSIKVMIEGAWNEDFKTDKNIKLPSKESILFLSSGVFWLKVSATDTTGCMNQRFVRVYVKEG